ncbi:MAG: hypothetical protein ACOX8M_13770 [Marvinbryantia sp.]|jgi:hypothetical protein
MSENFQARKYLLTINNPEVAGLNHEEIKRRLMSLSTIEYYALVDEVGSKAHTRHTHVFLYSSAPIRFSSLKKRFPVAHIERSYGSCKENRDYLLKTGKWENTTKADTTISGTFEEAGTCPEDAKHEKYGSILQVIEALQEGKSVDEVVQERPQYALRTKNLKDLKKVVSERYLKEIREVSVTFISDPYEEYDLSEIYEKYGFREVCRITAYKKPMSFDNYDGQKVLLLDNFTEQLKIPELITLCQGYPLYLPARYEDRVAAYNLVIIHSRYRPEELIQGTAIQKEKLLKMITKSILLGKDGTKNE